MKLFMQDTEECKLTLKNRFPHLDDEKISQLYYMIDALAYLLVENSEEIVL